VYRNGAEVLRPDRARLASARSVNGQPPAPFPY
jgi:hypothetical protein